LISATRNIDATGSGVIGQNVILKATGELKGVFFSPNTISLDAGTIGPTTALGRSIDATGPAVGPVVLIGTDKVNFSGSGDPTILSQNANGGGATFTQGTVANSTSQGASNESLAPVEKKSEDENDLPKKKGITLAQKVSRVTVLLPKKN